MKVFKKELKQEDKERLLIERVIFELEKLPSGYSWAYSSNIQYCIGLLQGFKEVKYK